MLPGYLDGDVFKIAKVSFGLRRMQTRHNSPLLTSDLLKRLVEETELPLPREQADNLVIWLGNQLRGRTGGIIGKLKAVKVAGITGATTEDDANSILRQLKEVRLIEFDNGYGLSLKGWDKFFELERTVVDSRIAFMAMPFGDDLLDRVYREYFRPAVKQTGFDLRRIDDDPRAGLIDHRLRVEIRRSRFLIAELTGGNKGAYWEAGFAEGLGRPVFYSCRDDVFKARGTHFDTEHCHTIRWKEDQLDEAARELKETIRATLPAEAILHSDDEDEK